MTEQETKDWLLSKTSFMRGMRCIKLLYLSHHKRTILSSTTKKPDTILKKGTSFEKQVQKSMFPGGENLQLKLGKSFPDYIVETRSKLDTLHRATIFEAGFCHHQVFVLVDVIQKREDSGIEIFEIKNTKHIKSSMLWDAGLQYYVCSSEFGERLQSFNLIIQGSRSRFKVVDVTNQVKKLQKTINSKAEHFILVVKQLDEPAVAMGKHCNEPYECDFKKYCTLNSAKPGLTL